jgi:hypothetical protein
MSDLVASTASFKKWIVAASRTVKRHDIKSEGGSRTSELDHVKKTKKPTKQASPQARRMHDDDDKVAVVKTARALSALASSSSSSAFKFHRHFKFNRPRRHEWRRVTHAVRRSTGQGAGEWRSQPPPSVCRQRMFLQLTRTALRQRDQKLS